MESYDVDAGTAEFDEKMIEKTGKTAEEREAGKLLEINMAGMDIDLTNQLNYDNFFRLFGSFGSVKALS